jgi:hypothetical protein
VGKVVQPLESVKLITVLGPRAGPKGEKGEGKERRSNKIKRAFEVGKGI